MESKSLAHLTEIHNYVGRKIYEAMSYGEESVTLDVDVILPAGVHFDSYGFSLIAGYAEWLHERDFIVFFEKSNTNGLVIYKMTVA